MLGIQLLNVSAKETRTKFKGKMSFTCRIIPRKQDYLSTCILLLTLSLSLLSLFLSIDSKSNESVCFFLFYGEAQTFKHAYH